MSRIKSEELLAPALLCQARSKQNTPLVGGFGCSSLVLYGIRELAPAIPRTWSSTWRWTSLVWRLETGVLWLLLWYKQTIHLISLPASTKCQCRWDGTAAHLYNFCVYSKTAGSVSDSDCLLYYAGDIVGIGDTSFFDIRHWVLVVCVAVFLLRDKVILPTKW